MIANPPETLVHALASRPDDPTRGFRFLTRDRRERFYSWKELEAEARRRAAHLAGLGLKKGDRIALVIPEPYQFVLTFVGAAFAGVVPVPVSPRASFKSAGSYVDVVAHIVQTSGSLYVFAMHGNADVLQPLWDMETPMKELLHVEDFFDGEPAPSEAPAIGSEDLCFLQFTSGSTSKPKGVMVTHANLVANAGAFLGPAGLDAHREDHAVAWLPLFHDMGLIGFVLGTLLFDLPATLIPTERFARTPRLWLETISRFGGTITYAPNFGYDLITKRVRDKDLASLDLSTLRAAGCGAEPIRAKTLRSFADKFASCGFRRNAFVPSYGMAEATLAITFHDLGEELLVDVVDADAMKKGRAEPATDVTTSKLELVSCGKPFPEHEVRVVDDDGNALGERAVGQVVTRGPSVTAGYFENEEATTKGWKGGWLQTGDLGYFADGNLHICGRIKELIIIRGANHYPQDIEWAVGDLEKVRRGNVIAFSVMRDGVEQLIVAAEAVSGDAAALREEIPKKVLGDFGLATDYVAIVPVGSLPKTSSGKMQRAKTKILFEEGTLEEHP